MNLHGLIGISEKNLWYTKHQMANPKIKDTEKIKKVAELKKEITEPSYYSRERIEYLCKKFDISVEDFITYYINKANFFDTSVYQNALDNNNGLWIGKKRIREDDIEKYQEMIKRIISTVINAINQQYAQYYLEQDMKSEMSIFIMCSCGDLVDNFQYDAKLMERMIWLRTREFCKIKCLEQYEKDLRNTEFIDNRIQGSTTDKYEINDTKKTDYKTEVEEITELFKSYLVQGYDKNSILEILSNLFNIDKDSILKLIRDYLLETKRVVQNKKGDYEIGE